MDARRELIVDDTGWIVAAIVNLLVVVFLALALMSYVILGAGVLFAWALGQGFVGAVLYFAAWFFLLPVMLIASTVIGVFTNRTLNRERREWEHGERIRNPPFSSRPIRGTPPTDPDDRYKWANRLPPFDG